MSGISAFLNIVKDCSKIRNLPKILLRSFENAGPDDWYQFLVRVSPAGIRQHKCHMLASLRQDYSECRLLTNKEIRDTKIATAVSPVQTQCHTEAHVQ